MLAAKLGAGAAHVMRRQLFETHGARVLLNDLQHGSWREILAPGFAALEHRAKDLLLGDAGRDGPGVERCFDAGRNGIRRNPIPFPVMSTSTQRFSRWAMAPTFTSESSSVRRNPQPSRRARMAYSRLPLRLSGSGSESSSCACSQVSQLPMRFPRRGAPFTSLMEAVRSRSVQHQTAAGQREPQLGFPRSLSESVFMRSEQPNKLVRLASHVIKRPKCSASRSTTASPHCAASILRLMMSPTFH
jgi:hypothetical protein